MGLVLEERKVSEMSLSLSSNMSSRRFGTFSVSMGGRLLGILFLSTALVDVGDGLFRLDRRPLEVVDKQFKVVTLRSFLVLAIASGLVDDPDDVTVSLVGLRLSVVAIVVNISVSQELLQKSSDLLAGPGLGFGLLNKHYVALKKLFVFNFLALVGIQVTEDCTPLLLSGHDQARSVV